MKMIHHMAVNIKGLLNAYKGRKIDIIEDGNGNKLRAFIYISKVTKILKTRIVILINSF